MRIVIFGKMRDPNMGDMIIADCLRYLIENEAESMGASVDVVFADVLKRDKKKAHSILKEADVAVFPGGGINSVEISDSIMELVEIADEGNVPFCLQGIGVNRTGRRNAYEKRLRKIIKHKNIMQVYNKLSKLRCKARLSHPDGDPAKNAPLSCAAGPGCRHVER